MTKRPPRGKCIHCLRDGIERNWDHVFPAGWYPDTTPENVEKWKVPSCVQCNSDLGRLESRFVSLIALTLDPNAREAAGIPQKVLRSLKPDFARNEADARARLNAANRVTGTLQDIVGILHGMTERFQEPTTAAAPHLSSADRATFKRLMLEAKAMLDADLGHLNDFSSPLMSMTILPRYGAFNPPTLEQLQEAIEIVEGGLNHVRRKQSRPAASLGAPQKPPYVAPSRIAELQALKNPKWDPRRLIGMLQELNLAHANGMDMATAMLVRAVTDHVPPIFGKTKFADVAAQHAAGSIDGRSFKGAMSPLIDSMKHIADGILHVHIRTKETLPSSTQVDFSQSLDLLLGEVVRELRS